MRKHHTRVALTAAVAAGSLLAAGCGSSSHNPSASAGQRNVGIASAAFKYSACMRAHGVPNFPDPHVSVGQHNASVSIAVGGPSGINPHAPAFRAAAKQCQGILPTPSNAPAQNHTRELDLLSFAQCLRAHGLSNFPDPTSQGQLTLQMITNAGVDLHAPQTLTAAKACIGASRGAITPADVEQAVNGPS
jgi:hypothetical protein